MRLYLFFIFLSNPAPGNIFHNNKITSTECSLFFFHNGKKLKIKLILTHEEKWQNNMPHKILFKNQNGMNWFVPADVITFPQGTIEWRERIQKSI